MSRVFRRGALLAGALSICGLAAFANAASAAAAPARVTISAVGFGVPGGRSACPTGSYVDVAPGVAGSPVFMVIPPGPGGCPPGVDVLVAPGPPAWGGAVSLPLGAADCETGLWAMDVELGLLGAPPPAGPPDPTEACPGYGATLAALESAIATLPAARRGGFGLAVGFGRFGGPQALVMVRPGPFAGLAPFSFRYALDATGSPAGVVTIGGYPNTQSFTLGDTGTAGVAAFGAPGPITS